MLLLVAAFWYVRSKRISPRLPAGGPPPKLLFPKLSFFAMNCMDGTPLDGVSVPSYQDFEQHMKLLFSDLDEEIYLRLFHDANKKRPVKVIRTSLRRLPQDWTEIERCNRVGYCVTVMVNQMPAGAQGNDDDITGIRAFFWEHDEVPKEEQWEMAQKMPMQPSFCMESNRSIHFYYLVKESDVKNFRRIQRKIARLNGSDSTLQNPSRVLRCAGTLHSKNPEHPFLCRLLEAHPERVYTEAEFEAMLDEVLPEEPAVERYAFMNTRNRVYSSDRYEPKLQSKEHLQMLLDNCDFIAYCRQNAADLPEPLWRSMLSNLLRFESGEDAAHELSKDYPGYSVAETQDKMEAIKSSKVGPIRCDTIREYGFNCPKHCGCAAPAVLPWLLDDENWEARYWPDWYPTDEKGKRHLDTNRLVEELYVRFPCIYYGGWHLYESGVYRARSDDYIKDFVSGFLHPGLRSVRAINEVTELWRLKCSISDDLLLNNRPWLVNIKSGLYNTATGTLESHTPDYKSTIQLDVDWEPECVWKNRCPVFMQFLSEALSPDDIPVLQEYIGYALSTSTRGNAFLVLYGPGRTGKSVVIKLLENMAGREHCTSIPIQNLNDRFMPAQLQGKLLNLVAELPSKPIEDSFNLKALTGNDAITVEQKNQKPFQLHSLAKLIFSANNLPRNLGDKTNGFYRRLLIIEMPFVVPPEKVDPYLLDKLVLEKPGIFAWAMEGLRRLDSRNYTFEPSENSNRLAEEYRQDSDNVLQFIEEEIVVEPDPSFEEWCYCRELYTVYQEWCRQVGYQNAIVAERRFSKTVEENLAGKAYKAQHSKNRRAIWKGITFRLEESFAPENHIRRTLDSYPPHD